MVLPTKPKGVEIQTHENSPHFFTVIVSPSIQLRKLRIPDQFVRDHGRKLSAFAYLKVPNGKDWLVQLLKCEGKVWFQGGWNLFAENYSISTGWFLVFRYDGIPNDGISRFRVLIFNITCSEIKYSCSKLTGGFEVPMVDHLETKEEDEQGTGDDDPTVEILDDIQGQSGKSYANRSGSPLQRAMAFRSPNPNFIICIHKRNLSYNSGPFLPISHCRKYFKESNGSQNNSIILRVNKKTWRVNCRIQKRNKFYMSLAVGWKEFALKNELQDGDRCVFEMIRKDPKTYNVHFFRISEQLAGNRGKSNVVLEKKAKAFVGDSPGFILPMRKSYVVNVRPVHVPAPHSKGYLKDDGADLNAIVIRGEGRKTWKVGYRFEGSCAKLSCGWSKFKTDNRLEIGDMCAFKLVNEWQKTYDVAIFRINGK